MAKLGRKDDVRRNRSSNDNATGTVAAVTRTTPQLSFVLLDYHGGIEDLSTRILRCPVPCNTTLSEIYSQVIQSSEEENLALSLGLGPNSGISNPYSSSGKIQALWWAKMLRDDPYRLLRTLRFKETLGFRIDPSFWLAVPFALQPGIFNKVSHTRKIDELRKVAAGAGAMGAISFLATILSPRIGGSALRDAFFSTTLFPDSGNLGVIDIAKAQILARYLPLASSLSLDERVGAALVVSLFSCESSGQKNEKIDKRTNTDTDTMPSDMTSCAVIVHKDASVAVSSCLGRVMHLVEAACDGIKVPTSIRRAAMDPILTARRLLEPLPVLGMHILLAQAVGLPSGGVSRDQQTQQYANMVRLWELLLSARRKPSSPDPFWVLALVSAATDDCIISGSLSPSSGEEMVRQIEGDIRLLLSRERSGGVALGGLVAGLPEVPPHLRGQMVASLEVLMRLRGDSLKIQTPEQLRTYLEVDLDNLLTKLANEWWVCEEYSPEGEISMKSSAMAKKKLRSVYAKKKKR